MKNKDPLLINKILSAFLIGGLVVMSSNYLVSIVYHPETLDKSVYEIEIPETESSDEKPVALEPIATRLHQLIANKEDAIKTGTRLFKKCASCHSVDKGGKNKVGPNLWNIVGNSAGKVEGFAYSANLPAVGKWTFENLDIFIQKPSNLIKKTKMSFAGIKKPEQRAAIILYLRSFSDDPVPIPSE